MTRNSQRLRLCVVLLTVNLVFIWGNSLLPAELSSAFSQWVKSILQMIFPSALPGQSGSGLVRKLAHFCEFCTLGLLLTWLFGMLCRKWFLTKGLPLLCGAAAAGIDETIQCFVPGRGPSLRDVGIDTLGVTLGIFLLTTGYMIRIKNIKYLEDKQL